MRIYTRRGDTGETYLPGGVRVPKDDPRLVVCGDLDELNAALGMAGSLCSDDWLTETISDIQSKLLTLGSEIASLGSTDGTPCHIVRADVEQLEGVIDRCESLLPPLTRFLLPGGSPCSAALHVARAICRRAERSFVVLGRAYTLSAAAQGYLNRLSDLLFVLARFANRSEGVEDKTWMRATATQSDE